MRKLTFPVVLLLITLLTACGGSDEPLEPDPYWCYLPDFIGPKSPCKPKPAPTSTSVDNPSNY
jgi:hypothetical protein